MALPPLELFSLKKRPPCCRAASSLFRVQLLVACGRKFPEPEANERNPLSSSLRSSRPVQCRRCRECKERYSSAPKEEALHVSCSASCVADINCSFVTRHFDMAYSACRRRGSRRK